MKKSQIQKIIFEELATALQERKLSKAQIQKLKDAITGAKNFEEASNAIRALRNAGVSTRAIPKIPKGLKPRPGSPAAKAAKADDVKALPAPKTGTAVAKTTDKATDVAKKSKKKKSKKKSKKTKGGENIQGPVSGVSAAIRPGMPVPLRGPGSRVFKGRTLDDIAKEFKMPNYPGGYMNSTEFLLKAMAKRRRLALKNPAIAIPPRPGLPVPVPGSPGWKPWVMSDKAKKWLKYAGLTAAAAALLGAASMLTPEEQRQDPNPVPDPEPGPTQAPGPDGGGAGPNAEKCKTARGVRQLLKQKAEEITGKRGVRALTSIPLKGDDNSWIRVSYRELWSARRSRASSEKARAKIVAQYGEQLGCTVPGEGDAQGGMTTSLKAEPGMLGIGTRGPDFADLTKGAAGQLKLDPSKLAPEDPQQPQQPQLKGQGPKFQAFMRRYRSQRELAKKAIRKRNEIIKAVLGRPLRGEETFKGFMDSPTGQRMPQRTKNRIAKYEQYIDKISKDTAGVGARLVSHLQKRNPNFSRRQLYAFIQGKPMTGSGETPADLPQAGQRDTAALGIPAAERAKLDMTGGPPPALQESKELSRMKLLAGIKKENIT